jgi:hypothetical protein
MRPMAKFMGLDAHDVCLSFWGQLNVYGQFPSMREVWGESLVGGNRHKSKLKGGTSA